MSPVKNKEDTWKASELEKHIRTMKDDKGSSSRSKRHDDDKDKQEKRQRDDSVRKRRGEDDKRNRDDKERKPRDDRERRSQDDSDRRRRDDEKRHRDENDREKTRSSKTKESFDTEKRNSSKHRDEDDDERRRRREERKRREVEEAGGGDRDHRRHRDKSDRETDGKRHRDDGEKRRDRERDDKHDEKREKHRTKQTKQEESESKSRKKEEKERPRDNDPERRHRRHKEDGDSHHRATSDRGDSESRHRKQREKRKDDDDHGHDDTHQDSRKHRREKEEEEEAVGENMDRAGKRGNSEKTEKEERRKKRSEPEKEKNYDEYEDDFEAYEDDFNDSASEESGASDQDEEEKPKVPRKPQKTHESSGSGRSAESGKEMDDILQALDEENRRLLSSPVLEEEHERRQNKKKESLPPADRPTFINFVSAKQRAVTGKTSQKIRTRAKDLLNIIEFDTVSFTLFEQHSEKEYDRFIRSFGRTNAMQAYVQTNEDNLDQEIQTEEIGLREKWSQHPPEAGIPPCGGDSDQSTSADFGQLFYKVPWDVALDKGIRVIETLLEENNMEYMHKNIGHKQSNIIVSEAFVELTSVSILKGRHVIYSQFSPDQNHLLLAVYSRSDKNSKDSNPLQTKGVVCIWNVYEPTRPQKILLCPSQSLCGCFSPVKSTLVFAGLEDGVVVTWDLREPDSLHKRVIYDNVEYVLRHPTYNTAMPYLHDSHSSPVIRLIPIVSNASKSSVSSSTATEECLSFQLASLEQNSVIVLWVVVELDRPDQVGLMSDFGLREGGRVKLVKSSVIKLESPRSVRNSVLDTTFECTDLQVWPKDNSQFIVATTSTGCVLHVTRHGGHISPKAFRPKSDYPFDVTSVDFSPFLSSIFLAGGSDGSIRLFRVDLSHALMTWYDTTDGLSIRMVRWCRSRPSVFFVLDEDSFIYIWDLNMDDSCALKKERIATSRVTSICLSNDHSATGQGLPDRPPQMVVFLETGVTEAHIIKKEFSALMPDEVQQFSAFIGKAIL